MSFDAGWLYRQIRPGMRKAEVLRLLGRAPNADVDVVLAALESRGYLLSEDEKGRLYPFRAAEGR